MPSPWLHYSPADGWKEDAPAVLEDRYFIDEGIAAVRSGGMSEAETPGQWVLTFIARKKETDREDVRLLVVTQPLSNTPAPSSAVQTRKASVLVDPSEISSIAPFTVDGRVYVVITTADAVWIFQVTDTSQPDVLIQKGTRISREKYPVTWAHAACIKYGGTCVVAVSSKSTIRYIVGQLLLVEDGTLDFSLAPDHPHFSTISDTAHDLLGVLNGGFVSVATVYGRRTADAPCARFTSLRDLAVSIEDGTVRARPPADFTGLRSIAFLGVEKPISLPANQQCSINLVPLGPTPDAYRFDLQFTNDKNFMGAGWYVRLRSTNDESTNLEIAFNTQLINSASVSMAFEIDGMRQPIAPSRVKPLTGRLVVLSGGDLLEVYLEDGLYGMLRRIGAGPMGRLCIQASGVGKTTVAYNITTYRHEPTTPEPMPPASTTLAPTTSASMTEAHTPPESTPPIPAPPGPTLPKPMSPESTTLAPRPPTRAPSPTTAETTKAPSSARGLHEMAAAVGLGTALLIFATF